MTLGEILQHGIQCQQRGDLGDAAAAYRVILQHEPGHSQAMCLLGAVLCQQGSIREAEPILREALRLDPENPQGPYFLGHCLRAQGRTSEAIAFWEEGAALAPAMEAFYPLVVDALLSLDQPVRAAAYVEKLERVAGVSAVSQNFRAIIAIGNGEFANAENLLEGALEENSEFAEAWNNLGNARARQSKWNSAEKAYVRALELVPEFGQAWSNLGDCLRRQGRLSEAIAALQRALELRPEDPAPNLNMGNVLHYLGEFEDSARCYLKAIDVSEAPASAISNYLMMLNYRDDLPPSAVLLEHRKYSTRIAVDEEAVLPRNRGASDRIRIGYISADFKWHAVSFFICGVLESHDRERFEVNCYHDAHIVDSRTLQLRELVENWHSTASLSNAALIERIRDDEIDVLIELGGHTEGNRLVALSRRAAPVQISWMGYPNTTAIPAIDYRITDLRADPAAEPLLMTEIPLRLEPGFLCFKPPEDAPDVASAPASNAGFITFGSFNHFPKVSKTTIRLWADVLRAVPGSRLVLKSIALQEDRVRRRCIAAFEECGVCAERIRFLEWKQKGNTHLEDYAEVDIALDPTPYNGTTTTCDALWMGVPVVTLTGRCHAARVGSSLLHQAGLVDWIAGDAGEYIRIATSLAASVSHLSEIRANLRSRICLSPLTNPEQLTRSLEGEIGRILSERA